MAYVGHKDFHPDHPFAHDQISFVPKQTSSSNNSSAKQDKKASSAQPDPMQPAIDSIEEMGRKDFGDRYNPKA